MPHADLPRPAELVQELGRLSQEVEKALSFLYRQAKVFAEAEDGYRLKRATLQLEAEGELRAKRQIDKPTVDEKRAWVDMHSSPERVEAHIAESLMKAGFEAVKARRAQLSALQSAAAAVRSELELAGKGPS